MYLTPPKPRVLAHRGFATPQDEHNSIIANTMRAFEAAVELGAMYIESDVRSTKDGVAVLLHDRDFVSNRAGKRYRIQDLTFDELDRVRLINGDRIPSVCDVLMHFPSVRFNLDVKEHAAADPLVRAVTESRASSRVLITSFSRRRRKRARAQLAHTFGGASAQEAWLIAGALLTRQQWLLRRLSREVHAAQLPNNVVSRAVLTTKNIERLHREQIEVHIWTLNEADEMKFWLERGASGIVTDRSDIALSVTREWSVGSIAKLDEVTAP